MLLSETEQGARSWGEEQDQIYFEFLEWEELGALQK